MTKDLIPRHAEPTLKRLARGFPVVAITGPRQSGKTTLARLAFPKKTYVSLENPEEREFATSDPKRFLARFPDGAILDEVQRCPSLLSWLQGIVDESPAMGRFVLTGSAQFDLIAGMTQSLAGRVGRVELLPLSSTELRNADRLPGSLERLMLTGGYPALWQRTVSSGDWFANYVATYLERDVRQLIAVRDLAQFQLFVRMCAARSGQILNLAALGADCGVSAVTARQWLSVLEASYLISRLPPHFRNFGKRLVKSPKLYFLDPGLMAWLLGIRDEASLMSHAARGALFETFVISEAIKSRFNQGQPADLYYWRDNSGNEIDLLFETPTGMQPVEIKSGTTFAADWTAALGRWQSFAGDAQIRKPLIIYGGDASQRRSTAGLISWKDLPKNF